MRFISPSFLLFTLLMSIVPWVEVRCEQRVPSPISLSHAVIDQNAFEIALGKTRYNPPPPTLRKPELQGVDQKLKTDDNQPAPAPLIWAVLGGSLFGVIVGYAVPNRRSRLLLMSVAVVAACGGMVAQLIVGFPLLKLANPQWIQQLLDRIGIVDPELRGGQVAWTTGFTSSFYLACLGLAGGAMGLLVDLLNPPPRRSKEDDEDDEDDRYPRRRRRRRDDDEDDRPRRQSRDEDKWPQRRRDDDEDDEDRPPPRRGDDRYRS